MRAFLSSTMVLLALALVGSGCGVDMATESEQDAELSISSQSEAAALDAAQSMEAAFEGADVTGALPAGIDPCTAEFRSCIEDCIADGLHKPTCFAVCRRLRELCHKH